MRISNIRLYAFRLRFNPKSIKSEEQCNNNLLDEDGNYKIPEIKTQDNLKISLFKRKLKARIQKKLRNIKNSIFYCLYTIGDIFGQTFCFIMMRRTKSTSIIKTVKI